MTSGDVWLDCLLSSPRLKDASVKDYEKPFLYSTLEQDSNTKLVFEIQHIQELKFNTHSQNFIKFCECFLLCMYEIICEYYVCIIIINYVCIYFLLFVKFCMFFSFLEFSLQQKKNSKKTIWNT